jgi:hypothetical protein
VNESRSIGSISQRSIRSRRRQWHIGACAARKLGDRSGHLETGEKRLAPRASGFNKLLGYGPSS